MTEQIEQIDTLDTLELIIQPTLSNEMITTKKEWLKQIRELKEQFKEHQANQIVEPPNTDEQPILKRSIKGRPNIPENQKIIYRQTILMNVIVLFQKLNYNVIFVVVILVKET